MLSTTRRCATLRRDSITGRTGAALPRFSCVRRAVPQSKQSAEAAATTDAGHSSFHHGVTYVTYEGNSFWVKFNNSGARVLVDPWLVGDLQFFEQGWLYTGRKRSTGPAAGVAVDVDQIVSDTDVVLISQWVDDHTHMPTLQALPRSVPIIAQPEAAERIRPLGFDSLTVVRPGDSIPIAGGRLQLTATQGALVGPPWSSRQNGYLLRVRPIPPPAPPQ